MALPAWPGVRESLAAAIRDALPLQVHQASCEHIAGIGLHVDAYYGSAGLYLLPQTAAHALGPKVSNIGDWPISTGWDLTRDHAVAFAAHWRRWEDWFKDHLDGQTDAELDESSRGL
jgi:hypothetical protein